MFRRCVPALALLALAQAPAHAGGGPSEVVVVVNADSPASLAIANAWIAARRIDPSHVVLLRGLPGHERVSIDAFRGRILLPVVHELQRRALADQVQWIVYSADLPWAVEYASDLSIRPIPSTLGRNGSLTGLTVLAPQVAVRNLEYCLSWIPNPMYRMHPRELSQQRETLSEEVQESYGVASRLHQQGQYREAADMLAPLFASSRDAGIGYDLACALAMAGDVPNAMAALEAAEKAGWNNAGHTMADSDLTALRALPAFTALIERLKGIVYEPPETRTWDRRLVRLPDGGPGLAAHPGAGWMSAMLAVTSGRGLSVRESLAVLARGVAADASHPTGTVYLMRNGDVRSTTRQWAFSGVVAELKRMGAKAEIADGILPKDRGDIVGLVAGSAHFDMSTSGSTILPGAICEHLTSYGGVMGWNDGQTPLTEFLRHGAAGATGTVEEPHAFQFKFPSPFMQVHYQRGVTLGEAVWQSVANPYQLLLVGDPLCAPWAVPPRLQVSGLAVVDGQLRVRAESAPGGPALAEVRIEVDGRERWRGAPGQIAVSAAGWPEGPHRIAVTGVAAGAAASQSSLYFPVGTAGPLSLECASPRADLSGAVPVRIGALAGMRVALTHLGRDLLLVPGGKAHDVKVPAAELGLGRSELQAEARNQLGEVVARSVVVPIDISEPPVLPALPEPTAAVPGVRLIPFDRESSGVVVATGRLDGNWLVDALGGERAWGEVMAGFWIHVESDDLTQIQIHAMRHLRVAIDGEPLHLGGDDGWRFGLFRAAKGWHRLHLRLEPGEPQVEVRLGIAGTAPIVAASCRCPAPSVVQPGADAAEE